MIMKEAEEQAKWCCGVGLTCRIENLSFGHKAMERDEKKGKVSSIGIKGKPKKKTEEKKKKAAEEKAKKEKEKMKEMEREEKERVERVLKERELSDEMYRCDAFDAE